MHACAAQGYNLLSCPGVPQVVLCGANYAPSTQQPTQVGWQWWRLGGQGVEGGEGGGDAAEDALEVEGGLSWHAGGFESGKEV